MKPKSDSSSYASAKSLSGEDLERRNVELIQALESASERHRSTGDRVADGFAHAVGSWTFIIIQSVLLAAWVVLNVLAWMKHWDPYPFILLNLALSFQAAYASPIIMMSQNRQARLDERRNRLDLQVNLLAEQENTKMLQLLLKLCEKNGIDISDEQDLETLSQPTEPERVVELIDEAEKNTGRS